MLVGDALLRRLRQAGAEELWTGKPGLDEFAIQRTAALNEYRLVAGLGAGPY